MNELKFDSGNDACKALVKRVFEEGVKVEASNKKNFSESYKKEIVELENTLYSFNNTDKMLLGFNNLHCTPWWIVAETLSEMLAIHPHITQKYAPKTFEWAYKLPENKIPCYSYGSRWAENNSLLNIYRKLKKNPSSKRAVVPIFNSTDTGENSDVPCTLLHRYCIRNNKLNVNVVWRSHDIFSGLFKVDLHLAYFLQNSLVSWLKADGLEVEPGIITGHDFSLHYYPYKNGEDIKILLKEFENNTEIDLYSDGVPEFPVLSIEEFYKELNRVRYVEEVSYGKGYEWCFEKINDIKSSYFRDWARIMIMKNASTHELNEVFDKAFDSLENSVNKKWIELYEKNKGGVKK